MRKQHQKRPPLWGEWFNMVFGASRREYVVCYNTSTRKHEPALRSLFS